MITPFYSRCRQLLACAVLLTLTGTAVADDSASSTSPDEEWQVIFLEGQRVGYMHSRTWESMVEGRKRFSNQSVTRMTIKRFGAVLRMTISQLTEEDEDGNLLRFVYENDNPPISNSKYVGVINGDTLEVTISAAGQVKQTTQPWDLQVKSPVYQDRLLEEDPVEAGETREITTFEPQFLKVAKVTLEGAETAETKLFDGTTRQLERVLMKHSLIPGMTTTVYSNEEGDVLKTEASLLQMVTYSVSEEEALKEIAGEELDLAVSTLVKVDPIPEAHSTREVTYEMTLDQPAMRVDLPVGPTQQVQRIDDQHYRITVTALDPTDRPDIVIAIAADPEYLAESRQVEITHPAVVALADAAAGDRTDPVEIALAMEKFVHRQLKSKNFSTALATAAEVAQTKEGDCTEHAVLLAAMLRHKQIPSRVAVGLVYAGSHSAFGGHMWTEAFLDARWVPLDATLGRGGIGGGHIKFADSSLADDGPAPVTTFVPLMSLLQHMSLEVIASK